MKTLIRAVRKMSWSVNQAKRENFDMTLLDVFMINEVRTGIVCNVNTVLDEVAVIYDHMTTPTNPTGTPMSLGPQNPTKKLTHLVDLLGHLLSQNHVSNFSDLGPPPPPP